MILRPCKKCLVYVVCEEPCPRIIKRKERYETAEMYITLSCVLTFLILLFMIGVYSDEHSVLVDNIITLMLVYVLSSFFFGVVMIRVFIHRSIRKFGLLHTGISIARNVKPPPAWCRPKTFPPAPPPKKYP